MKKHLIMLTKFVAVFGLVAVLLPACKKNAAGMMDSTASTIPRAAVNSSTVIYRLAWSDEFNGSSIDPAMWNIEVGNAKVVNNEKEYYQARNIEVKDGNLVITARKETVDGQPYTSGKLTTYGLPAMQKYGRIEARIKIPMVNGTWPAFWMLGHGFGRGFDKGSGPTPWPDCGEIDIMEHVNDSHDIQGTLHWNDGTKLPYHDPNDTRTTSIAHPDEFHVYAVEWDKISIRWYVDDVLYFTRYIFNNMDKTDVFNNDYFYLIFNLAVGGNFTQNMDMQDATAQMLVDYVRIYNMYYSGTLGPLGPYSDFIGPYGVNTPNTLPSDLVPAARYAVSAPIGQTVAIKGNNNLFVSSENGTQAMNCNRASAQDWEKFTVVDAGGGKVALRSQNKFVSSENGTQPMTCNRASFQAWETFTWVANANGTFSLIGNNGKYVSSENGNQPMTCNRSTAQAWEQFTYQ